jgi:hypothetical protein
MGTNTHSTPSLRFSRSGQAPLVYNRRKLPNLRASVGASAAQLQTVRLWIRSHAGACPPPAQRTVTTAGPLRLRSGQALHSADRRLRDDLLRSG